jgi:hypothetical protein
VSRAADFEQSFREAVGTGAYNHAGTLLHGYLESINEAAELTRARNLIAWATLTVQVARAFDAEALDQIGRARRYFGPPVPAAPTCELHG